jgi:hypothetical protein
MAPLLKLLDRLFHGPAWLKFVPWALRAGGFALCSFNLLSLFQANLGLIATYGAMAPRWRNPPVCPIDGLGLSGAGLLSHLRGRLYGLIHQIRG